MPISRSPTASSESTSVQGAIGGGLTDTVSARVAVLYQSRGDWIDNDFTGESDAMGGFDELAWRAQLLLEPSESFSALLNVHGRDIDGTSSIFRANVLGPGSDGFNSNYDRDSGLLRRGRQQSAVRGRTGRVAAARLRLRWRHDADLDHRVRENREQQPRRHRRWPRRGFPAPECKRRALPAGQHTGRGSLHPVPIADAGWHRRPGPVHAGVPLRLAGE